MIWENHAKNLAIFWEYHVKNLAMFWENYVKMSHKLLLTIARIVGGNLEARIVASVTAVKKHHKEWLHVELEERSFIVI